MKRVSFIAESRLKQSDRSLNGSTAWWKFPAGSGVSDKSLYAWVRQAKERQGAGSGEAASLKGGIARLNAEASA